VWFQKILKLSPWNIIGNSTGARGLKLDKLLKECVKLNWNFHGMWKKKSRTCTKFTRDLNWDENLDPARLTCTGMILYQHQNLSFIQDFGQGSLYTSTQSEDSTAQWTYNGMKVLKMHILLTVLHTSLMELVRRICLNINTSYPWWSLSLFLSLECLNK